ncbi:MAG: hydrogenase [Treponema sp.]|uniref:nitrogenase component 1 n=1 Tax=Treponema sp. TaxID=166 RepID=UPI0025D9B10A|nr:nitrogenase component 1 [Treponema sp.]MBQ8679714.1 hydrogenase [Treponema sp.]
MNGAISQPRFTCALGAQCTVLAIPRAIPIIHAGPGCSNVVTNFTSAGYQGECYAGGNQVPSTNTNESHVVFGGEKDLRSEIEGALKVMKGDLFVALSGCTAGIIGDNTASVAKSFAEQGLPVVGAETSGFKGSSYIGHEIVVKAIIDQFVGNAKPKIEKGLVNVFADVPGQNPFWRGDLAALKILLEKLGLKVNILFGGTSAGVSEWKTIPNAEFNLLVSPWVGLDIVEHLKQKYGTPYLHYPVLPVGGNESSRFLREVGKFAGLKKEFVESVIECEEKIFYDYFVGTADFFATLLINLPYELYVTGDSLSSIGITKFLDDEVGYIPKGVFVTDNPNQKNEDFVRRVFESEFPEHKDTLVFEPDSEKIKFAIEPKLKKSGRAVVFGSDWERTYTKKTGNIFLYSSAPINQQLILSKTYVGYQGGLRLMEDIYNTMFEGKTITGQTFQEKLGS